MPSDYITLNALASEIDEALAGGKIRRICEPEKDEITIGVYNGRTNLLLVISANPNSPRIHLTKNKKENPYAAPPFLMVLRKYVGAAVIKRVSVEHEDRIVEIKMSARNELFDEEEFTLVCELMGRYSNIILLNDERRILDSLYKLIPDEKQKRQIMVGARYLPPEQNKPFVGNADAVEKELDEGNESNYKDILVKKIAGIAAPSAEAILAAAKATGDLSTHSVARVAASFSEIRRTPYYVPCVKRTDPQDFYPYERPALDTERTDSLNEAADEVFTAADRISRVKAGSKTLEHALTAAIKKAKNSVRTLSDKLVEGEEAEEIRIRAELITTNLYRIDRRDKEVTLFDYYSGQERTIPLDPVLSPKEYAQKLFKRYQKLKRGKEINETLLKQNQDNLLYYDALAAEIKMAETAEDLALIEEEMREAGILKIQRQPKKKEKERAIPFLTFEAEGYTIYCGKGGLQNEHVTFKVAKERDVWLHAAKSHGAHVIVKADRGAVPERILLVAAEIAAYYSERRGDQKVEVDYTERKNVRRHPAKKIGLVYYTDYMTVAAKPNAHEEYKK